MKLILKSFCVLLLLSGCLNNSSSDRGLNEAKVKQIQGIYIFIESEPFNPYDKLGDFKISVYDKLLSLSEKSVSEVTKEIVSSFLFDKNLQMSVAEIKLNYPDANGIIFNGDMSSCAVIKFK